MENFEAKFGGQILFFSRVMDMAQAINDEATRAEISERVSAFEDKRLALIRKMEDDRKEFMFGEDNMKASESEFDRKARTLLLSAMDEMEVLMAEEFARTE